MNERVVLQANDIIGTVWNHSGVQKAITDKLGRQTGSLYIDYDHQAEGFGSIVAPLKENNEDSSGYVLKIPKTGQHKPISHVIRSLAKAGISAEGIWIISTPLGSPTELRELQADTAGIYDHSSVTTDATHVVILLKELPPGNVFLDKNFEAYSDVHSIYFNAGIQTRKLHSQELHLTPQEEKEWHFKASTHIILGDERLLSILQVIEEQTWLPESERQRLLTNMKLVAKDEYDREGTLVRTHGDNWEGNWWISDDTREVTLFDPASAYGRRGEDIAFAIGKQLISYLRTGDIQALRLINAFYDGYGRDELFNKAKKEMWKGLAFKMVVGAAFDGYDDKTKLRLVMLANNLLEYTTQHPGSIFEISLVENLWNSYESTSRRLS